MNASIVRLFVLVCILFALLVAWTSRWTVFEQEELQDNALNRRELLEEQRIPLEIELDDADASAVHAVARNRLGQVVGTGRLLQPAPGVGKIGRMAVHRVLRGGNVGRRVLLKAIREGRLPSIQLSPRCRRIPAAALMNVALSAMAQRHEATTTALSSGG